MNNELLDKINYYYKLLDKIDYNINDYKKNNSNNSIFDYLLNSIYEKNNIINVYGNYSVGKTSLSLYLSGLLSNDNYFIYYFDSDGSINLVNDIKRFNINSENFILFRINEYSNLLDIIFNKLNYNYNSFIVIDSLDSIDNITELKIFFVDLIKLLHKNNKLSILIVNQMRKIKLGPFYFLSKTFSNINFFYSIILKLVKKNCYILKNDVYDKVEIIVKKGNYNNIKKYNFILKNGLLVYE